MSEQWKDIEGHPGYEVSSLGRIRRGATILRPWAAKNTGYLQVDLAGCRRSVHRLVAFAFCPGKRPGLIVNHRNGARSDDRASNLEWVTPSENQRHSYRELGRVGSCKGVFGGAHPTSKAVVRISPSGDRVRYECASDAFPEGFKSAGISNACRGKAATHKGYRWEFA